MMELIIAASCPSCQRARAAEGLPAAVLSTPTTLMYGERACAYAYARWTISVMSGKVLAAQ
ncbi:MAG TPA: hypothetical protein VJP80_05140 [Candidatus Saccharimonadales bacterium]|nr:hypothetical protein [Candidatus Saccharimonadales bacterium]